MPCNIKPLIRTYQETGERFAGFLDIETGAFTVDMKIESESDIDIFLDKHGLSVVMISKI